MAPHHRLRCKGGRPEVRRTRLVAVDEFTPISPTRRPGIPIEQRQQTYRGATERQQLAKERALFDLKRRMFESSCIDQLENENAQLPASNDRLSSGHKLGSIIRDLWIAPAAIAAISVQNSRPGKNEQVITLCTNRPTRPSRPRRDISVAIMISPALAIKAS